MNSEQRERVERRLPSERCEAKAIAVCWDHPRVGGRGFGYYDYNKVAQQRAAMRTAVRKLGNPSRIIIPVLMHAYCPIAFTRSSTTFRSTLQPAVRSSGLASSISLWLMPPTHGTNTIAVGATRAM